MHFYRFVDSSLCSKRWLAACSFSRKAGPYQLSLNPEGKGVRVSSLILTPVK